MNVTTVTIKPLSRTPLHVKPCRGENVFLAMKRCLIIQFKQQSVTRKQAKVNGHGIFCYLLFLDVNVALPASSVSLWVNTKICTNTHITPSFSHTHTHKGWQLLIRLVPCSTSRQSFHASCWLPWQLAVCVCVCVGTVLSRT